MAEHQRPSASPPTPGRGHAAEHATSTKFAAGTPLKQYKQTKLNFKLIKRRPIASRGRRTRNMWVTPPQVLVKTPTTPPKKRARQVAVTPAKHAAGEGPRALEQEGLGVIMLEDVLDAEQDITREALLSKDHLLLPMDVVRRACWLCGQMVQLACCWPGSGVELGNEIWEGFLLPGVERTAEHVGNGLFARAFAELLGLVLFTFRQDAWIREQEAHHDWSEFRSFFEMASSSWSAVLAQGDEALGLASPAGRSGGYRPRLLRLLQDWQDRINRVLDEEGYAKQVDGKPPVTLQMPCLTSSGPCSILSLLIPGATSTSGTAPMTP